MEADKAATGFIYFEAFFLQTIKTIILKRLREPLTPEEEVLLAKWMEESDRNRKLVEDLSDPKKLAESFTMLDGLHPQQVWERLTSTVAEPAKERFIPGRNRNWYRMAGYAATILLCIVGGALFYLKEPPQSMVVHDKKVLSDIAAPSANRSVIILANGSYVYIDSIPAGIVAIQKDIRIQKNSDGSIVYTGTGKHAAGLFNTLSVPRGSQITRVTLADGSVIVLNAGSTMKYPVAFQGNERHVDITGEAYLEVFRDKQKKFIVTGRGITTEVLGTHFNINNYPDETEIKITLLEGSVKVSADAGGKILKPGEQVAYAEGVIRVHKNINLNQVVAWKNGLFDFQDKHLPEVMRQLARWYDLRITYSNKMPEIEFFGQMNKNLKLSEVLTVLRDAGVKCKLEKGNHLIVL